MSHQNSENVCVIIEDNDLADDEPGPPRAVFKPSACSIEADWFNQTFDRPTEQVINCNIPQECLSQFQDLIWNRPHDRMVPGYGLTPKELASVSSDGRKGWLVTSHFYWLSRCLNQQQQHTRFFVLDPAIRKASVEKLLGGRSIQEVRKLIFVLSVGRQDDGVVFLGTDKMQGDHWSVAVVDLVNCDLSYCDTLGWPAPENFLSFVIKYTYIHGISRTNQLSIRMAHKPNVELHQCTPDCTNYPLQTCSDVCGVIAMVCIATAALDKDLFEMLLTPINKDLNLYLTDPTTYSSYLRHVLIYWLITGFIDISRISLKSGFNPNASRQTPNLKRKVETECNGDSDDGPKRRMMSITHLKNNVTINEYILEALEKGVSSEDLLSGIVNHFTKRQNGNTEIVESCIANMNFNNTIERNKDDALSIKSYCKDLSAFPNNNPILLYKYPGKEMKTFELEDVVLGLQTPFQKEMMKAYGKTCICVDVARKNEGDKYYIITFLVSVEEYTDLPVAWLITTRNDNQVLSHFLKSLNINVGALKTDVFLGDINAKVYKVWAQHFPKPAKRMFNTFEVQQALNQKVEALITGKKEQNQVKSFLNLMFTITDVRAFKGYLQALLEVLKPYDEFLSYFRTKYVEDGKDEFWASCYRRLPGIKYVPFLKSHRNVLKLLGFYDKQKMNRLDVIMHKLLQMIRFLENKLHIQPNQARLERTVREIEKLHIQPLSSLDIFLSPSGEEWYIRASAETNAFSIVDSGTTDCNCQLVCKHCKVCVHRYICSCCDYLVSPSSCKHIHMVSMWRRMNSVINDCNALTLSAGSTQSELSGSLKGDKDIEELRAETQKALERLSKTIPTVHDVKTLQEIIQALQTFIQH